MYLDDLQLCDEQPLSKSAPRPNRAKAATSVLPREFEATDTALSLRSLFMSNRAIPSTDDKTKAHVLVTCDAILFNTVVDTFLPLIALV